MVIRAIIFFMDISLAFRGGFFFAPSLQRFINLLIYC